MRTIISYFLFFATSLILYSCAFGGLLGLNDYNKEDIISSFDKVEGGICDRININGYYYLPIRSYTHYIDSEGIIFFNDGSCSFLEWRDDPPIYIGIQGISLKDHLKPYYSTILHNCKHELCGGMYVLKDDTIIVDQIIYEGGLEWYKQIYRYAFKIEDRNTLVFLYQEIISKKDKYHWDRIDDDCILHYVPTKDIPFPIDMYNKTLRDCWSSKQEWTAYREKRKLYIKNKRQNR